MPDTVRLYDDDADSLLSADSFPDRVSLLPSEHTQMQPGSRIRVMWGQDMLRDVVDGRYRSVICSVNDEDNARGLIAQLVSLVTTSQWSVHAVTSYAKSGYRGDVYAAPGMWRHGHVGVFPSYPFPAGLDRMRSGSS